MAEARNGKRVGRNEVLLLALGFGALAVVGGSSIWIAQRNASFNRQIADTLEFRSDVRRILDIAQDAETGQRGYLLTRRESYLTPYEAATPLRDARVAALRARAATEIQRENVETLVRALDTKLAELARTVELSRAGRWDEALEVVRGDSGREAMVLLRSLSDRMVGVETQRFQESFAYSEWLGRLQLVVVTIGLLLAAALALVAQILVRRQARTIQQAHAELADANAGLEQAVADRTAELVSANEEIQRFAYIVSHDLRAPLVNVMGFTSELDAARKTLKEQIDKVGESAPELVSGDAKLAVDEDLLEAIGFIRTSTAKMDRLINAILRLSREGRRVITPEMVKVDEVVVAIARTLHQQTEATGARITAEPGLPTIVTDRMSFEQVFQNLIENAVKYLDRSRPGVITVRGRRVGPQVEYAIEDNGRGIDAKDHERVFELFRRAGAQDQPGEGLGLAFVRASVRRLGGTIRLDSEPGRGSTFTLTFPAVYRPQQTEAS